MFAYTLMYHFYLTVFENLGVKIMLQEDVPHSFYGVE